MKTWLVTGGAGFIGSHFVRIAIGEDLARIVNLDKLAYSGHRENLTEVEDSEGHRFVHGDIAESGLLTQLFAKHRPDAVIHFAAQASVDRSLSDPHTTLTTNVLGTQTLLQAALEYWRTLRLPEQKAFRFLQISTDEVYGSLDDPYAKPVDEQHAYAPNSPYAASKAAADYIVRAYHRSFGLPTVVTHAANTYGPYQHPDKLIPVVITNARARKPIPIYGDGKHMRDWLHVDDHCRALLALLDRSRPGESYNIGAACEKTNLQIVGSICRILDDLFPSPTPHIRLVTHVLDRPGHDRRYAVDSTKLRNYVGWSPRIEFDRGLETTVRWYLDNAAWIDAVCDDRHEEWLRTNYERRGQS